jgi:hypothetical protein
MIGRKEAEALTDDEIVKEFGIVKSESRISYGIEYFETLEQALDFDKFVQVRGDRYNGGYYDGTTCGRDYAHDHVDKETGKQLYAVTVR